jgi:hypothetical protein
VPFYPPKASVYHPGAYQPPAYGTPTHGYSGPVPSYSASYEQAAYYGAKEGSSSPPEATGQTQSVGQVHSAVAETNSPAQLQTTGFDSITVQAAPNRGARTNEQQPRTRTSAVRFIESRSGHAETSSSPAASSTTSSAVKFESAKRKRSPQKQFDTEGSKPSEFDVVRWHPPFFRLS